MDSNILITICARGGSKGIPKKNIKPLNGIPLIYYSIDLAKKISKHYNSKIALSTDDIDILKTTKKNELKFILRQKHKFLKVILTHILL